LGVQNIVLTNAAGSVDPSIKPGTTVLLTDHINFTGRNCLIGMGDDLGERFVDMQHAYDPEWREKLLPRDGVVEGVYAGVLGPNYETAAETAMFGRLGAHIVGMSTVQEAIAARQIGLRVLGISFVTNMAGGLGGALAHEDVLKLSSQYREKLHSLLSAAIAV
jgi:purine-nucleoside phosphorylase